MQWCIVDNVNNGDQNNVSPIWWRIFLYFRQIANRFAYGAIGDRLR